MPGLKMSNRMKILISVNSAWNVWNFRRPLVETLIADGHQVTVLAPKDDSVDKLVSIGCRVRHLEMSVKGLNPVQDLALMVRLNRIFRKAEPDVILSFTIKNNVFGAFAAKIAGIPFIPNVTGLGTAFLSGGLLEQVATRLYKSAFRRLPIIFFQNGDDQDLFVDRGLVSQEQARLLPGSGIDLARFSLSDWAATEEPPLFLMIARLLRDKGVLEYVAAARIVKSSYPEVRFGLLGAADVQNRTAISRSDVKDWEDEGLVEYLGKIEDVRPVIEAAQCIVLPSYREGAPRTLIEAAALGRPVIATDVPGCRSVVEAGRTGFLCDVKNADSLADACKRFLHLSPQERANMGRAGREKMERDYDQGIVVTAYRSAIHDVFSSKQSSA